MPKRAVTSSDFEDVLGVSPMKLFDATRQYLQGVWDVYDRTVSIPDFGLQVLPGTLADSETQLRELHQNYRSRFQGRSLDLVTEGASLRLGDIDLNAHADRHLWLMQVTDDMSPAKIAGDVFFDLYRRATRPENQSVKGVSELEKAIVSVRRSAEHLFELQKRVTASRPDLVKTKRKLIELLVRAGVQRKLDELGNPGSLVALAARCEAHLKGAEHGGSAPLIEEPYYAFGEIAPRLSSPTPYSALGDLVSPVKVLTAEDGRRLGNVWDVWRALLTYEDAFLWQRSLHYAAGSTPTCASFLTHDNEYLTALTNDYRRLPSEKEAMVENVTGAFSSACLLSLVILRWQIERAKEHGPTVGLNEQGSVNIHRRKTRMVDPAHFIAWLKKLPADDPRPAEHMRLFQERCKSAQDSRAR